jgi:hypothetical protein
MGLVAKDNPRGNYQRMEIASLGRAIFDVGAHRAAPKYTQSTAEFYNKNASERL